MGKIVRYGKPVVVELVVTVVGIGLLALMMLKLEWGQEEVKRGIWILYGMACFLGGIAAGKTTRQRRFIRGLCYGGLYFLALWGLSLAGGRQISADTGEIITILAVCAVCGMAGGMVLQLRGEN